MSACLCVTKSLMTALTFLLNKSHTFSLKAFFPSRAEQTSSDSTACSVGCTLNTSGPCDSHQLPFDWMLRGGEDEEVSGGGLAGSGHMRENKFLPHCHGDESTAGRGGSREGRGVMGHRLTCCS